jgi:LCP family protein required for cell wall assembly
VWEEAAVDDRRTPTGAGDTGRGNGEQPVARRQTEERGDDRPTPQDARPTPRAADTPPETADTPPETPGGEPEPTDTAPQAARDEPAAADTGSPVAGTESQPTDDVPLEAGDEPETLSRSPRVRTAARVTGRSLVALLSAIALTAAGLGWAMLDRTQRDMNTTNVLSDLATAPKAPSADDGATDILLIGSDSRTDLTGNPLPANLLKKLRTEADSGLNTDTIIVLRIPKDGGRAHAISVPRDTSVPIPGYRDDKINAVYGMTKIQAEQRLRAQGMRDPAQLARESDQAGRRALVQTVQDVTGLRIDHYAEISLYGFYLLTQALGGVDVCLKHATSDPDSGANFPAGEQQISGGDALAFVRQRENLPRGDLDRIVRQQAFLGSALRKVLSAETFADPSRLGSLMDAVQRSVVLDKGWDVVSLLRQAQGLVAGNVDFVTIPVVSTDARNERGQSVVTIDRDQVHAFIAALVGHRAVPGPAGPGSPPADGTAPAAPPTAQPAPVPPAAPPGAGQPNARSTPMAMNAPPKRDPPDAPATSPSGLPCVD